MERASFKLALLMAILAFAYGMLFLLNFGTYTSAILFLYLHKTIVPAKRNSLSW